MKLASAILALVLFVVSPCHADDVLRVISGTVHKVSDGDTIQVTDSLGTKVKVRLYGIDAPETEKRDRSTGRVTKAGQSYGEEALQALTAKVKGRQVQVEGRDIDRYKRAVLVVRVGSRDINEEMVREGGPGPTGAIWSGRMRRGTLVLRRRQGGHSGGSGGKVIRCRGSLGRRTAGRTNETNTKICRH